MNYIGKFIANFREFYNEINGATLTGAIDVVVVEQPDGSFTCSPFHVRFGKLGVLRSRFKVVDLELNGEPLNIHMKLGESGEAFFVEEIPEDELESSAHLATSPIPDSRFEQLYLEQQQKEPRRRNSVSEYPNEAIENQISDFSQRRYTDGLSMPKPDLTLGKREYNTYMDEKQKFSDYTPPPGPDQEPMFPIDDLDDVAPTWPLNEASSLTPSCTTPKTFKPAEVGSEESEATEAVRKISINNDFKPILLSASSSKEAQLNIDETVPQAEEQKQLSSNGKKKKKVKKSGSKKKHQRKSSSSSNGYCSQSEQNLVEGSISSSQKDDTVPASSGSGNNLSFLNDPDLSLRTSDPSTPVLSDTEAEMSRISKSGANKGSGQSWRWGELPEPPPRTAIPCSDATSSDQPDSPPSEPLSSDEENAIINAAKQSEKGAGATGMLSGMFSFMKHKQPALATTSKKDADGVYLADLADGGVDPEVAALYFPPHQQTQQSGSRRPEPGSLTVNIHAANATEEDYESGNGPSLPQSPSSIDGPMMKGLDSDEDDCRIFSKGYVGLSLCGPASLDLPNANINELFENDALRYEDFCSDPSEILQNPRLVVRIGDKYFPWPVAASVLMSTLVYRRPLPRRVMESLTESLNERQRKISSDASNSADDRKGTQTTRSYSWWSWRRSTDKQTLQNEPQTPRDDQGQSDVVEEKLVISEVQVVETIPVMDLSENTKDESEDITESAEDTTLAEDTVGMDIPKSETVEASLPLTMGGGGYSGSQSSEDSDDPATDAIRPSPKALKKLSTDKFRKSLRLTSDQIASLNLKEGMNEVVFSVTTAYQGTTRCKCNLFRWKYDDKIVISDIDGTITKSDVLGHIFPLVGKDWAQSGVAQLFTKIKNNGYKLLYLSARAIGQARVTREYLRSIKQGDLSLPDGPLLLNPTSLLRAFHREVIEKKPEEFKIQCLSDIKALFPQEANPFYAGYGNRVNDVCAYQAVGIPIVRIFTINYKGELKHELTQTFQSTYSHMSYIVDQLFPPVLGEVCEDFSQCLYWREPVLTLEQIGLPPAQPSPSLSKALPTIPELSNTS